MNEVSKKISVDAISFSFALIDGQHFENDMTYVIIQ